MLWYPLLRNIHVLSVALSFTLFALRGVWMLTGSEWLHWRPVKVVPHVVDTVLLASAIGLVLIVNQYPFVDDWLTAKVLALIVYIGLGMVALKRGPTRAVRCVAWVAALLVFGYIVSVAVAHNPYGFLSWFGP